MEIEHNKRDLTIHLDTYIQETLAEYKAAVTKLLKPKQVLTQPGIMLELEYGGRVRINLYTTEYPDDPEGPHGPDHHHLCVSGVFVCFCVYKMRGAGVPTGG